ncbi:MAG: TlpA disulfide reductase family protein [Salinivirgaceae bacterium]|jgi:peroxiredoxin
MKRLLPIILIAFIACNTPKEEQFILNGTISGDTPEKAYLKLYQEGKLTVVDSTDILGGEFTFDGKVDFPDYYYIQIGELKDYIGFFVENSEITISGNIDSLTNAKISGSSVQLQYEAYQDLKKVFDNQSEEIYKAYKEATDDAIKSKLAAKLDSLDMAGIEISKQYVKNNSASVLAPFIIQREIIYYLELPELDTLTNALSPELANYQYTQNLTKRIAVLKTLQPGMAAPDFTQNDKDGNPIKLSDFKGKVVLVDFWASWCGPCRRANPTVVAMFKKYNSKGFTVLGVSMDNNREKWLAAIETDGLTWPQVSTLEGWANPVGKLYGVNSIPHAVLINRDGTIIKRGVNAEELDGILGEIFK